MYGSRHQRLSRVSLPAKAEAQVVHRPGRAEAAPGVIKAQPRRPASVFDAAAQRQTVRCEIAAALLGRHTKGDVIGLIVRLNRVTRTAGDGEAPLADVLHAELKPRSGTGLRVVRLREFRQHGDSVRTPLQ